MVYHAKLQERIASFRHGVPLLDDERLKTVEEENMMRQVPYAFVVGSLMYAMLCTRPDC